MKRTVFAGLLLVLAAPAAWADCHLPKVISVDVDASEAEKAIPPCLQPLYKFANLPHTGPGAAQKLAALWVDHAQAEIKDPLGFSYGGRAGIQKAFEGKAFSSLFAGRYRVTKGSISHGHVWTSAGAHLDDAGILEWDASIEGAPGGGRHHAKAVVVRVGKSGPWAFHSLGVTAALGR